MSELTFACPLPINDYPNVLLAHGGGGRLTQQLIDQVFKPGFANSTLDAGTDAAVLHIGGSRLAFTTDSFVVKPLFFPGGDIGDLAVSGMVNDLAMMGATPLYLSCGMILEEGLPMETLTRVVDSMRQASQKAEVTIVTGDTKVVERGLADGLYINTSGIGVIPEGVDIRPQRLLPGDVLLISGDIGRHGMAIMSAREGLEFESPILSDVACLHKLVQALIVAGIDIHCLRDLTRGGLATSTVELAETTGLLLELNEASIPVTEDVRAACEILGFDPMFVANEGCMLVAVSAEQAERALAILRSLPEGANAAVAGQVQNPSGRGRVELLSQLGTRRVVDRLSGEQLPRIC